MKESGIFINQIGYEPLNSKVVFVNKETKGASKELEQAQKKVLTQWRKTFKKGFSSSEEEHPLLPLLP